MLTISRTLLLLSALIVATACGNDDENNSGETEFTASVAAAPFVGELNIVATYSGNTLSISGSQATATGTKRIELGAVNVTAPGDYTINAANPGNFASYSETTTTTGITAVWMSSSVAGTGTIVITHVSASRVTGEFNFNPVATSGGASGAKLVTFGVFDIPVTN